VTQISKSVHSIFRLKTQPQHNVIVFGMPFSAIETLIVHQATILSSVQQLMLAMASTVVLLFVEASL
jgi:chemotaxis response regulator CheB